MKAPPIIPPPPAAVPDAAAAAAREPTPYALLQALEGPAGSIPFAMRFDQGAATVEFALPLGMFEAFSRYSAKPAPPAANTIPPTGTPPGDGP